VAVSPSPSKASARRSAAAPPTNGHTKGNGHHPRGQTNGQSKAATHDLAPAVTNRRSEIPMDGDFKEF